MPDFIDLWGQAALVIDGARQGVSTVTREMLERARKIQAEILQQDPDFLDKLKDHKKEIEEARRKFSGPEGE